MHTSATCRITFKLDELIRATHAARNELISAEQQPEEDLSQIRETIAQSA